MGGRQQGSALLIWQLWNTRTQPSIIVWVFRFDKILISNIGYSLYIFAQLYLGYRINCPSSSPSQCAPRVTWRGAWCAGRSRWSVGWCWGERREWWQTPGKSQQFQLENTNRWQISSCESNSKIAGHGQWVRHHLEVISESHRHLIIIV